MAVSQIVWTPVPNGYAAGKLRLSVLVSPRLSGADTLAGYPDWLTWPTVRPTFSVAVSGGATVPAQVTSPAPRLDLWQKLFTAQLPVAQTPAARTLAAAEVPPIRSWPADQVQRTAWLEHTLSMATSPTQPPRINDVIRGCGGGSEGGIGTMGGGLPFEDRVPFVHLRPDRKREAAELIANELLEHGVFTGGSLGTFTSTQINFLLAEQFHRRSSTPDARLAGRSLAGHVRALQDPADIDFHAAVGSLAQYPRLQRALGLVVDLTVDPAALGVPIPTDPLALSLKVEWTPTAGPYEPIYPVVSATLTPTAFRPRSTGTRMADGLLALDTGPFGVLEVDPDAGAAVLATFSQTVLTRNTIFGGGGVLQQESVAGNGGPPLNSGQEPAPLPALRSTGLSVVEYERARALRDALVRATGRAAGLTTLAEEEFTAEDLTQGVRVDVWDDVSGEWHSLCRRVGKYDVNGIPFDAEDEGFVTVGHTQHGEDPTLYLHESMFTWAGYSLVTNRPGAAKEVVNGEEVTVGPDSQATGPVKLHTSFRAKGLPKLRYGRSYRFRARTVDIAGNSLGSGEPADFAAATEPVKYLRFEPVASPLLLPTAPRTVAESLAVMVIRGNYDQPSTQDCQRHVVPARMSQDMAEQHGLYDVPPTVVNPGGIDRFAYSEIVKRDKASLTGEGEVDPDGWGQVEYYPDLILDVPYLPDLLARGAALRGLPGLPPDEVYTVDFGDDLPAWPRRRAFRIRLVSGTGKPDYNSAFRVLTVQLPPGRSAEVKVANRLDDSDVDLLGIWDWFVHSGLPIGDGLTIADLRKLATQGQLWQLTPAGTVRLVHASRQPVKPSTLVKPVAVRKPGETAARIMDELTVDRASTAKVDIHASWAEPVDELTEPGPVTRTPHGPVTSLAVAEAADGDRIRLDDRHEFHDTKHRRVTYSAVATSRHVEFFRQHEQVTLHGTTPVVLAAGGVAAGTVSVTDPDGRDEFSQDLDGIGAAGDYVLDLAAGTIARSGPGSRIADGAAVAVSFVAGSVTRANTEAQDPVVVNVRSSGRPAVPDVAYLVPTFGWDRATGATSATSTRRGNGVRVYLRRPWYSSGEGEMLGVVLFEGTGKPANLEQYVTLRGQDPLFATAAPGQAPGTGEFPLAVGAKAGFRLAESARIPELATVAVAPHPVGYDAARQLWYCDITMTEGKTYSPFVRFALARFQPDSLTGVELSPVLLAQFAQLNPDRTLSTVFAPGDPTAATVTVAGLTYKSSVDIAAELTVLVQVADPRPMGALGWKTVSTNALTGTPGAGQWTGNIRLPAARGSVPMRLVVEERERFSHGGSRLVYADAIEI